jgi:hypothetical protein
MTLFRHVPLASTTAAALLVHEAELKEGTGSFRVGVVTDLWAISRQLPPPLGPGC